MSDSKVFDVHSLPSVSHYNNSWLVILGVKCIVCRTLCVQFFNVCGLVHPAINVNGTLFSNVVDQGFPLEMVRS